MLEPVVSSEWLNKNSENSDLIILDASPKNNKAGLKSEFADIQIQGARFFDLNNDFSDKTTGLPCMLTNPAQFEQACRKLDINQGDKIVVYDNLGIYTSPRVWWMFKAMGHEQVAVLDGGLPVWVNNGFETQQFEINTTDSGNFKAHFNRNLVRDIESIKCNLKSNNEIIVDARSHGRFEGTEPEPRKGLKSGHIRNSMNIPFNSVLTNGHFKSKKELSEIFAHLREEQKTLTFMCGSGVTACIVLLASELVMNNKKSVFDGSWTAWASANNTEIIGHDTT